MTAGRNTVEWLRTLDMAYEAHTRGVQNISDRRDQARWTNIPGNPCQRWYSGWDASGRMMPTSSQWPHRERSELETSRSCSIPALQLILTKRFNYRNVRISGSCYNETGGG